MKHKNILLYPIFIRCCAFLTDPFWKYLFEDFAYAKAPYGIIVNEDGIHSIIRNKEFSILFEGKSDQQITQEICHYLSERLAILSQKDHVSRRNTCEIIYDEVIKNITCWNDIRKKKVKDLLIEQFVLEMKTQYSLSIYLSKILFSIIFIGIQFKTITSKHIAYDNGKIHSIHGIECKYNEIHCKKFILSYS